MRSQRDDEAGLSEVIGFILLLAVIVAAFSLWIIYVVPVNGREGEITQMNNVKDRFIDYKISLDSLWINSQSGVTLSTSFDLGTNGGSTQVSGLFLPLLNPIGSSAVLSIQNPGDTLTVNASCPSGSFTNLYNMSVLQYQSQNNYWIQQTYYYQLGGVFLSQQDGATYRLLPPISIVNNSGGTNSIVIVPIQLSGSSSIGGNGPVRVDSRLMTLQSVTGPQLCNSVNLSVNVSSYTAAQTWASVFNATLMNGGITNTSWYVPGIGNQSGTTRTTTFMLVLGPSTSTADVYITIKPVTYSVTLNNVASGIT